MLNPFIKLPIVPIVLGRQDIILERCYGKRVLHLGCVDAGYMHDRFSRDVLMHQRLAEVANDLYGVDIDEPGISFLRDQGFIQLSVGDICRLDQIPEIRRTVFDVIVAGEVVEHLQNPGMFFESVKTVMQPNRTELIVTVPNAFRFETLRYLLKGIEYIHPDHNYWFSYQTISNLFTKNRFAITDIAVYTLQPYHLLPDSIRARFVHAKGTSKIDIPDRPHTQKAIAFGARLSHYVKSIPRRLLLSWLYRRTPFWGDGLVVFGKAQEDS